ncbi:MAG TPA: hypothetical protein VJZ00_17850 [Thermoanaerobaculia bacterium]|nr:hypothetical protein [Thermoanaerobaculia bacterium]
MRTTLVVLMTVALVAVASAQEPAAKPPAPANADIGKIEDFRKLFEEREMLVNQMRSLERQIADRANDTRDLPSLAVLNRDKVKVDGLLKKAQTARAPDQALIDSLTLQLDTINQNLELAQNAEPELKRNRAAYDDASHRLFSLEQRIASLFDADRDINRFRTNVTYTFGVLVFIVIVGFYIIAWNKQGVATTIFSGAMGMQFVTLFLIVIAIILFGIMGTLEGKELAALLGGLSGYILGRADSRRAEAQPANPTG